MATVDGLTKERMLAIEAESVTGARLDVVTNHLILVRHDLSEIDVGNVQGPIGPQGPPGTPLHGTTVAGPANFGDAPTPGVDTTHFSMADHDHGLPAVPSPALTSYTKTMGGDVAVVHGAFVTVLSQAVSAGEYLVLGQLDWTPVSAPSQFIGSLVSASGGRANMDNICSAAGPTPLSISTKLTPNAADVISLQIYGFVDGTVHAGDTNNDAGGSTRLTIVKLV